MDEEALRASLLTWYEDERRDLPWRETTDPYSILVSEVMLQQTQVSRVVPQYEAFLERFPTLEALAEAPLGDVIEQWDGLGFNNRAKRLQRAAETVVEERDGRVPREVDALEELPGVGPYTANAVASFAFDDGGPVFDANVRRVLHRFHGPVGDDELRAVHERLFPDGDSRRWNNAIMELGALVCTSGTPECRRCPWREDCTAWTRQEFSSPETRSQSDFEGSWRSYRSALLKALMEGPLEIDDVADAIELPERYDAVELVEELEEEGMVVRRGETIALPD
jgi:A/G-specific adenine glycosylase